MSSTHPEPTLPTASLSGKIALVTGGNRGIGAGIALELAARGASIVIASRTPPALTETINARHGPNRAIAIQADLSDPAAITRLFESAIAHYGRLDIVVSNAGVEAFFEMGTVTAADFDRVFAVNTRAQFFVGQAAGLHLARGGRLVLMSSVAATMKGVKNHALYAGSKCAVEGFTRSFAADFGVRGITVNAIAPGGVKTDMFQENAWHYVPGGQKDMPMEKIDQGLADFCPLGRVGYPVDIARVVAFLCSQDGEWVNGQVLLLTGGSPT